MDDLSMRDITAMMRDEDRPDSLEMGEYVGNYSGDRIRFPGVQLTGGEGDLSLAPGEMRGDCSTEVWFADKACKYLVFQDTDGDVAILDIHHLIKRATEMRQQYDAEQAEQADPIVATPDVETAAATPTVIDADEFAEATDGPEFPDPEPEEVEAS